MPPSDPTPPVVVLDVFGIPLQQGASSQPNPETVNSNCCNITRQVKRTTEITLIARGDDKDGGVKDVRIVIALNVSCLPGQNQQPSETYDNPDTTQPTPGTTVGTFRIISHTFKASDYCGGIPRLVGASITAHATNFYGATVQTKNVELLFP